MTLSIPSIQSLGRGPVAALLAVGAVATVTPGRPAGAQENRVPESTYTLDGVVVVVHRTETLLRESVAATTVLTASDIEALGALNLWEVLHHVPGLTFVERDGSGQLPMAVARGFFGGGETSYVLLMVDGVPGNETRTGVVEWSQISPRDIERIEILRGSASVVYGDAALGAVVNIVTKPARAGAGMTADLSGGSWGELRAAVNRGGTIGPGLLGARVALERNRGYRERSRSSRLTSSFSYEIEGGVDATTDLRLSVTRLENEEPGPLTPSALAADHRASHPAFAGDDRTRWASELHLGTNRPTAGGRFRTDVRLRRVDQDRVRTLLLTPSFGDTQLHGEGDWSLWARGQYSASPAGARLVVGAEAEVATYDSRYCDPAGCALAELSEGSGRQWNGALHAEVSRPVGERLLLTVGVRFDAVRLVDTGPGPAAAPTFSQWSPRIATNFRYHGGAAAGHVFAMWTRAFKVPTLDQMYDSRLIPSGQPGVSFNISNADLRPQRSTAVEVGIFQKIPLGNGPRHAELSASVYDQWLSDEIDFDIRTFTYGNILESRHRGVEAGLVVRLSRRLKITESLTLGSVTFRSGPLDGNHLKNIPRRSLVGSVRMELVRETGLTLVHRNLGGVYLDDENSLRLDGSDLFDAGFRWVLGTAKFSLTVRNLFDTRYESTGFLLFDPGAGADVPMTFPGGGRFMSLGVSMAAGASR